MENLNNYPMQDTINQELANMNIQPTQQLAGQVLNMIAPYVAFEMNKAMQSNQIAANALNMVQQLMWQNQSQIMQIAKLKQEHHEMPRLFAVDQTTGCGYCLDNGKEKKIGIIKISSVYDCEIEKNGIHKTIKYVSYIDSNEKFHNTIVRLDKLANKNLIALFEGFVYVCRSKALANDYLANCINNFHSTKSVFFPEYPGFIFVTKNNKETAEFNCNNGYLETELLKECSVYYMKKVIPKGIPSQKELREITAKYLNTYEKCFLFIYSVCGLLSSLLNEINCQIQQILAISAPNQTAARQAAYYMQIFNRGSRLISFDSSKSDITKTLLHAKDETIIINDCSIIDNDNRRTEMLQHILTVDESNDCQPHNLAIFSFHAQYILPAEKKICLTLPENFAVSMTRAEEVEMCRALDSVVNYITYDICKHYVDFKSVTTQFINDIVNAENNSFINDETRISYAILSAINLFLNSPAAENPIIENINFCKISFFICKTLKLSHTFSGNSADTVAKQFIESLNQAIRNNELKIFMHSKKMNYIPNANQLIVKDDLLIIEEDTIKEVIIPHMRTADSVFRILKCLDICGYLHSTKKMRYPLTVHSNGKSLRPAFIAVRNDGELDMDIEQLIQESAYSEWFSFPCSDISLIPIVTNSIGQAAYQKFDFERALNMHFFAIGQSSSGKTHCLTERMCSMQKLHHPIIIFDTSDSFTEEAIFHNLSANGGEIVKKRVGKYIKNHITFHMIEEKGLPVDLLKLNDSTHKESKIRTIQSIFESHRSNMGVKQKAVIYKAVKQIVDKKHIDMHELYNLLTSEDIPDNLANQLSDMFSCFIEFELSEKDWGDFIDESKDIIVISTHAVSASGGSGLIDMLLMSLFYYQKSHADKHLSIFIDEIKNQNLSPKGPISLILTEGRKYHIGLNYAAQFLPGVSAETMMVMENADMKAFFRLDGKAASAAAKQLNIKPNQLASLDTGECYIKGSFYNNHAGRIKTGIIHGSTYRNFAHHQKSS